MVVSYSSYILSPVCLPMKRLQESIAEWSVQHETKCAVMPMYDCICLLDHRSNVTLICVAESNRAKTWSITSWYLSLINLLLRYLRVGTLYLGSRVLRRSWKLSLSTVESGARLLTMNDTSFFEIRTCRGSFWLYFFEDSTKCERVVCSSCPFFSWGFSSDIDEWQFL